MPRAKKEEFDSPKSIRISTGTFFKLAAIVLAIIALYFIRDIVVIFLLALLLAALIDPFADWFAKRKINRGFAVVIVYFVLFAFMTGLFFLVAPTVKTQTQEMFDRYGPYVVEISGNNEVIVALFSGEFYNLQFQELIVTIQESGLDDSLPEILGLLSDTFGVMLGAILVLVLAFYLVVEEKDLWAGLGVIMPKKHQPFANQILPKAKKKTGEWLRGQLIIMFAIFSVTFIILTILNIPFALVLAIIAGLFEVIPFIGPILSAVPAVIIALAVSPVHALITLFAYFGVQQFEGQILTPKVMEKVTGINPVYSILAVLVGFELVGPIGAVLAIPVAVVVGVTLLEWIEYSKKNS